MRDKLHDILQKYESIENQLMDPSINGNPSELQRLGKGRSELEGVVVSIRKLFDTEKNLADAELMLEDPEMKELAYEEIPILRNKIIELDEEIRLMLIPKDMSDDKPVIVEIRPAAGGDEAGLFGNELFRMYLRYAERRKWKVEVIEHEETGLGSLVKVNFCIQAKGAFSQLKHESGVHRVQRVPVTESGGRIHTSTVTVAVLPEAEEVDIHIRSEDLEISTFRSSSAGGQHMQKNETAIRIVHKPTGLAVTCQDERSQQQNKLRAMSVLRTKLYDMEQSKIMRERGDMIRDQVGTGDRSEKIRTYHFPQSRITDHRIGLDVHNINTFMDGDIQVMLDALVQDEMAKRLATLDAG